VTASAAILVATASNVAVSARNADSGTTRCGWTCAADGPRAVPAKLDQPDGQGLEEGGRAVVEALVGGTARPPA
jgi:hypothetical protein